MTTNELADFPPTPPGQPGSSPVVEDSSAVADSSEGFTSLVIRMQGGDESAFVDVYRRVHPPLLRYLTALVGAEAEDVASETWSQACRDLSKFHGDGDGFRGWIATIGRHRALDYLRAKGRRPVADVRLDALLNPPQTLDAESSALEAISTAEAVALIATLPRDQAEAVLLRSVLGLDASAAGKVMGKRAGAVRTATYRGCAPSPSNLILQVCLLTRVLVTNRARPALRESHDQSAL
jgi:RNA polymerase sigma-70 factor, ECF subfamily